MNRLALARKIPVKQLQLARSDGVRFAEKEPPSDAGREGAWMAA